MAVIFGRASELEQIDAFLAAVADGPAALLLEGELGAGKTALWKEAVARAPFRVLDLPAGRGRDAASLRGARRPAGVA